MKNLIIILLIALIAVIAATADGQDTLWLRYTAGINELDFTPDSKYVIAWNGSIEFWEVQQGVKEFSVPIETVGDYNYNEEFLVFAQDKTPKLLDWKTREVIDGFEKEDFKIDKIRTAKSKNEFMATEIQDSNIIYFWDIDSKSKIDSLVLVKKYNDGNYTWLRGIRGYDYLGNNDEFVYVKYSDDNSRWQTIAPKLQKDNCFYHIYNRQTKELVDSLFVFQQTNENKNFVDKMVVMNDRSKIAWCRNGGMIGFYNVYSKSFYNEFKFDESKYAEPRDIDLSINDTYLTLANGGYIKSYEITNLNNNLYFNVGTYHQCKLSDNFQYMVGSIGGILIMHPTTVTTIEGSLNENNLTLSPNPASSLVVININSNKVLQIKLSIIDLVGNEIDIIYEGILNQQNYNMDYNISNLTSSTYFVRLEIGNEIITKQFIKE